MSVTLDEFVQEVLSGVQEFAADYRKQNSLNSEHYPLELPDDNAGLWFEFFSDFLSRDEQSEH